MVTMKSNTNNCMNAHIKTSHQLQEQADVALTVTNDENPAKLGMYNKFQNEDDVNPPSEYNQVVEFQQV